MYGKLDRGGRQPKDEPRVIADRVGLIESVGEGFKVGGEGSSGNRVVRDRQSD